MWEIEKDTPNKPEWYFQQFVQYFDASWNKPFRFQYQDDKAAEGEVAATVVPPESTAPVAPSPTPEAAAADLNAGSEFAAELACKMEALEAQEANKRKVRFDQHSPNKMFPTFPTKGSQHSSSNEKNKNPLLKINNLNRRLHLMYQQKLEQHDLKQPQPEIASVYMFPFQINFHIVLVRDII